MSRVSVYCPNCGWSREIEPKEEFEKFCPEEEQFVRTKIRGEWRDFDEEKTLSDQV